MTLLTPMSARVRENADRVPQRTMSGIIYRSKSRNRFSRGIWNDVFRIDHIGGGGESMFQYPSINRWFYPGTKLTISMSISQIQITYAFNHS